ncbi:MAG: T9SS type A sorting domain-containing protein, partial [Cryomorphaceae bacterium]
AYLPAGDYTNFLGCGGGKLIFQAGTDQNFEVLSNMPPIEEVTLKGPGNMSIANNSVNVCSNLIIKSTIILDAANSALLDVGGNIEVEFFSQFNLRQGNTLVHGNLETSGPGSAGGLITSGNNGEITIKGDLILGGQGMGLGSVFRETHVHGNIQKSTDPPAGSFQDGTGGAKLVIDGLDQQTITGDFTETSDIPSLELNNATGLTIDGNVDVSEKLLLTDGKIFTSDENFVHLTSDAVQVEPEGGQPTSFVDGPMQWSLSDTPAPKKFPIGKNDRLRPLAISNRNAARTWKVEYSDTSASTVSSIPPPLLGDPFNTPAIETVSIQEYWKVETDGGTTLANIGLSWGDDSGVSTDESEQSNLLVVAYNDGTGFWDSFGLGDLNSTERTLTSDDQISFSEKYITLGSSDELNPLPVTWLYFEGENKGKDNMLSWATSAEINNDYFELERSLDAYNWTSIAEIEGAGLSNSTLTYTYTDQNAPFGRVYYRLRQVDFDGKMEFAPNLVSLERSFAEKSKQFDFLLFPNPTQLGTVRFRMSNTYDVRANVSIFDLSGKQLSQTYVQVDGQGTSAPVECNYEPGIYLVRVIVNDKMRSKPLVITR